MFGGYNNSQNNAGSNLASCPQLGNDYNAWCQSVRLWLNTMSAKDRENTTGVVTTIMSSIPHSLKQRVREKYVSNFKQLNEYA